MFGKLLEDMKTPLYLRCMKYMKLSVLIKLYNLKVCYNWSNKIFSNLLQLLVDMLPLNNEMLSMNETKKTLNALGIEYQKIHVCYNNFHFT